MNSTLEEGTFKRKRGAINQLFEWLSVWPRLHSSLLLDTLPEHRLACRGRLAPGSAEQIMTD